MKRIFIVIVCSVTVSALSAQSPTENLKKYWFYRYRLINDFMKRAFLITIAFFFLFIAAGMIACKKKATKVNPDYIGKWTYCWSHQNDPCTSGCHYYFIIEINDKSEGSYREFSELSVAKSNKGIARIKDDKLSIGLIRKLSIDQPPTQLDSLECHYGSDSYAWYMILNGNTYYKE